MSKNEEKKIKDAFAAKFKALTENEKHATVAKALGLSESTISKLLTGRQAPSIEQLSRISRTYHISTDELLGIDITEEADHVYTYSDLMKFLNYLMQRACIDVQETESGGIDDLSPGLLHSIVPCNCSRMNKLIGEYKEAWDFSNAHDNPEIAKKMFNVWFKDAVSKNDDPIEPDIPL